MGTTITADANPILAPRNAADPTSARAASRGSKRRIWTGRILSGAAALFLLFDSVIKLIELAPAVEGTTALGYPVSVVRGLGVVELLCLVLYLVPRTSILGAIFLTGYLGGAVATHVRVGSPLFSHTLFPIYVAGLAWAGLYLRDRGLRVLLPLRGRA